jgi:hypothetical protein
LSSPANETKIKAVLTVRKRLRTEIVGALVCPVSCFPPPHPSRNAVHSIAPPSTRMRKLSTQPSQRPTHRLRSRNHIPLTRSHSAPPSSHMGVSRQRSTSSQSSCISNFTSAFPGTFRNFLTFFSKQLFSQLFLKLFLILFWSKQKFFWSELFGFFSFADVYGKKTKIKELSRAYDDQCTVEQRHYTGGISQCT